MLTIQGLRAVDTAPLHLKDATGKPMFYVPAGGADADKKPVLVTLYGPGSDAYRKAQESARRRVMALAKDGQNAVERTADERAADAAKLLASITVGFEGLELDGRPLHEVVNELYADPKAAYIANQVNAFSADWANFSPSAPQN